MAYQIVYEADKRKKRRFRVIPMTLAMWVCFILLVTAYWPEGASLLKDILLPKNPERIESAFEVLASDIYDGNSIPDALEAFCQEIISYARADSY